MDLFSSYKPLKLFTISSDKLFFLFQLSVVLCFVVLHAVLLPLYSEIKITKVGRTVITKNKKYKSENKKKNVVKYEPSHLAAKRT